MIQDYLAVTRKNILNVYRALAAANIPFAAQAELDRFSMAGKAQEIRLMRKCIKENGAVKETYQISIKGRGGLSSVSIATPETLDVDQNQKLREIFTAFYPEVNDRGTTELYFEIPLMGKENTLVQDRAGHSRTVEIDLSEKYCTGAPPAICRWRGEIQRKGTSGSGCSLHLPNKRGPAARLLRTRRDRKAGLQSPQHRPRWPSSRCCGLSGSTSSLKQSDRPADRQPV